MNYIVEYLPSFGLYIGVLLISWTLARFAEGSKSNRMLPLAVLILVLSLFSGLRAFSVGIDTQSYVNHTFVPIHQGMFSHAYGEVGFKALIYIILTVFNNYTVVFVGLSFIIVSLFVFRFWELRNKINFSLAVVMFYCVIYLSIFNTIRQLLATAIVFWVSRYLLERKYFKYILGVLIATLFHTAALVSICLILVREFLSNKEKITARNLFFKFILIVGSVFFVYLFFQLERVQFYMQTYANSGVVLGGSMAYLKLFAVIAIELLGLIINSCHYKKSVVACQSGKDTTELSCCRTIYLMSLIISIFGYYFLYVGRVAELFFVFEIMYLLYKTDYPLLNQIKRSYGLMISLYTIISVLNANGYGIMPYMFIFT